MQIQIQNVGYCHIYQNGVIVLQSIKINGNELKNHICNLLADLRISTVRPFSRFPYGIAFNPEIRDTCIEIFESIKELKKNNANEELAGSAASYLFEHFPITGGRCF
jgi:hypothetical protein